MARVKLSELLRRSKNNMNSGTHPVVRDSALELIKRAYKEGINVQISEGNRSYARQNELYAQGRTKSGNVVTNARGGQSWHNFGIAIDFFLTNHSGSTAVWTVNQKWRRAAKIGKSLGFEWGGDWTSFKDYPHLQMTGGYSLSQLRAGKKPKLSRHFNKSTVSSSKWKKKTGNWSGQSLRENDKGAPVKQLQRMLNESKAGYLKGKSNVDNYYGTKTVKAVKAMQRDYSLDADGIAGKSTYNKLKDVLTIKEYNKLKREIDAVKKSVNSKKDKSPRGNSPSSTHEDAVSWVKSEGISDGSNPLMGATREQVATMLRNYDNYRFTEGGTVGSSHTEAWEWLVDEGISDGSNPHMPLTREQLATILNRYDGTRFIEGDEAFSTHDDAWKWMIDTGISTGGNPHMPLTREQFATLLLNYNDATDVEDDEVDSEERPDKKQSKQARTTK